MKHRDKETLERLYWDEGMSLPKMGDELGVTHQCVLKWMQKHGIPRRSRTKDKPPHYGQGSDGYMRIKHTIDGEQFQFYVHRLLAVAKYGYDEASEKDVHHRNGIKFDNREENIEIMTNIEHNTHHGEKRGGLNY